MTMAGADSSATLRRHPAERRRGALTGAIGLIAQMLFWLFVSLVLSILIEWAGLRWFWPDEGVNHSRAMLEAEIGYLDQDFRRSVVTSDPARFARAFADAGHHYLFEVTGLLALLRWAQQDPATAQGKLQPYVHRVVKPASAYLIAAMTITQVFAVRLAILVMAMPAFILAGLTGLTEGLVQRDLRRWGGGRESSFLYHHARRTVLPLFVAVWVVYLALPVSIHPSLIILPFAALFGLSIAVTVASFKKYL